MQMRRRTNFILGLIWLLVGLAMAGHALGLLPPAAYDIFLRSWPALLVLTGIVFLLRGRLPGPLPGLIGIAASVALIAGLTPLAYSSRADQPLTAVQESISQPIAPGVGLLRVRVNTLTTDVELVRSVDEGDAPTINGVFMGGADSRLLIDYLPLDDGSATLTIAESRGEPLPMLASIGRGNLRLEIPGTLPLDVDFSGEVGSLTVNLSNTALERLNVNLGRGDAIVTLPIHEPLLSGRDDSLGTLAIRDGDMTLFVPDDVSARLDIDLRGSGVEPEYDPTKYNFLFDRVLEARAIDTAEAVVNYALIVPRGRVRLEVPEAS
jgi:hypothetical protein